MAIPKNPQRVWAALEEYYEKQRRDNPTGKPKRDRKKQKKKRKAQP